MAFKRFAMLSCMPGWQQRRTDEALRWWGGRIGGGASRNCPEHDGRSANP